MTKKIVVTGIGATSPLGGTAQDTWTALLAGESGATPLEHEWVERATTSPSRSPGRRRSPPSEVLERHETKRLDPSSQFALIAAREAWADAGAPDIDPTASASTTSTGIGGVWTLLDALGHPAREGPAPRAADDRADAHAERRRGAASAWTWTPAPAPAPSCRPARRAPRRSPTPTTTCSRARRRRHRRRHRGGHRTRCRSRRSRRCRRSRGATTTRRAPRAPTTSTATASSWAKAPRPRARDRGARARPRRPHLRRARSAARSRATRTTSPLPTPRVGSRTRHVGRARAGAGATARRRHPHQRARHQHPVGDIAEYKALLARLRRRARRHPVSATKASTGHLLGGTGALEALFTVLALHERTAPPTINLDNQDPEIPLDVVDVAARRSATAAARDQQLVRLRRSQRRRGLPHRVVACHDQRSREDPGRRTAPGSSRHVSRASLVRRRDASSDARVTPRRGSRARSAHLVQPDDGGDITGVAERLEFVVPRLAEGEAEFAVQFEGVVTADLHRVADAVLGDDRVARPCRSARRRRRGRACASSGRRRSRADGSSLTSNRSCSHPRRAEASFAPLPRSPSQ